MGPAPRARPGLRRAMGKIGNRKLQGLPMNRASTIGPRALRARSGWPAGRSWKVQTPPTLRSCCGWGPPAVRSWSQLTCIRRCSLSMHRWLSPSPIRWVRALLHVGACLGALAIGMDAAPPSAELASFQLADPQLQIELVAAEPDVVSPVALAWDAQARLFVAEMRDYPNATSGGQIRLLED